MEASQLLTDEVNKPIEIVYTIENEPIEQIETSNIVSATPPKKRKPSGGHTQKYRKAWEYLPEFQDWLVSVENDVYKAKCTTCEKVLVADLSVLQAHALSKKHVMKSSIPDRTPENLSKQSVSWSSMPLTRSKLKNNELSEDLHIDSLTIADQGERTSYTSEGGYVDQTVTVDMSHAPPPRKPTETPTYNSKAVVTKPAPPWKATAIVNGHVTRLELNDYKGRYLILFFYPQDFSAVCPTELLALSDRVLEFRALQTEIVACSVDSHLTHLAWARTPRAEGGLGNPKIPLLADPTHSLARDYGVLLPDLGHTLRAHFIIDRRGILRHALVNDLGVGRSIDELLRITQALQHVDETETGCPADWKPGLPSV